VVGHTVQMNRRINQYCGGRLVCIDTGMCGLMQNAVSALEIVEEFDARPIYP